MKRLFAFLFAVVAFVACEDLPPEAPPEAPSISIKTAKPSAFSDAGGEAVVEFVVSEDWVVEIDASRADKWLTVEPMSGMAGNAKITITAAPNDTYDNRTATVSIKAGAIKESISVNQSQKNGLLASAKEFEVDALGGTIDLDVTTNVDLTVTISDDAKEWISDVTTRAMETKTLSFEIAPNMSDANRSGEITIAGGGLEQTIVVKQGYYVMSNNQICYTSTDGKAITPNNRNDINAFGANIVSNVYENGMGIITFDSEVTLIGELAFYSCSSLSSITLPNSVTSIGELAFSQTSLNSIIIPDSVVEIGNCAFYECESLESITIPDSVVDIGDDVFCGCESLTAFYGKYASADNRCLIVDGVLKSFARAGLTSYTIPDGVTSIGRYVFSDYDSLASIVIPDGVISIGEVAFGGCVSLSNITLPNSVTLIDSHAFSGCSSLSSITIPDSVTSIVDNPFKACSSLTTFNGKYASADNRCLIVDGVLKSFAQAGLTSYTIPDGVTSIGVDAFNNCDALSNITIPDGVISIGNYAFSGCDALSSITISNSVEEIRSHAFMRCSSLSNVTLPDSLISIEDMAFSYCNSLASITLPVNVSSIGNSPFACCTSLATVYSKNTTPPSTERYYNPMFENCHSQLKIYVPASSVNAYKSASGWSEYASQIEGYDFSN